MTRHVSLRVSHPPAIADNSTRSVVVQENSAAELLCHATGSPPPAVTWRREHNAVLPTGGIVHRGNRLRMRSVKKEDRGTYYCVADNGIGKAARRNVAVEVSSTYVKYRIARWGIFVITRQQLRHYSKLLLKLGAIFELGLILLSSHPFFPLGLELMYDLATLAEPR